MLKSPAIPPLLRHIFPRQPGLLRVLERQPPFLLKRVQPRSLTYAGPATRARPARGGTWRNLSIRQNRGVRHNSSKPSEPPAQAQANEQGNQAPRSLSARFKELSRKYGWAALGVYLGLSVLDFPFCFLAVRLIGTERIGEVEHAVASAFWRLVGIVFPNLRPHKRSETEIAAELEGGSPEDPGHKAHEDASIWTQLLLAYGVHKSLIFFRIPLTAAVTPKVVKTLRGWGWNIGPRKRVPRSST